MSERDELIAAISKGLAEFFKGDTEKAVHWLFAENPNFGGAAPAFLIVIGRGHVVVRFITDAKEGWTPV